MPDGGALFDVLDDAVERGLDVRILFWRPNPESSGYGRTSRASPADRGCSPRAARACAPVGSRARALCQHQKSWLIDAGQSSETHSSAGST